MIFEKEPQTISNYHVIEIPQEELDPHQLEHKLSRNIEGECEINVTLFNLCSNSHFCIEIRAEWHNIKHGKSEYSSDSLRRVDSYTILH